MCPCEVVSRRAAKLASASCRRLNRRSACI
jgi:hypothetical protein